MASHPKTPLASRLPTSSSPSGLPTPSGIPAPGRRKSLGPEAAPPLNGATGPEAMRELGIAMGRSDLRQLDGGLRRPSSSTSRRPSSALSSASSIPGSTSSPTSTHAPTFPTPRTPSGLPPPRARTPTATSTPSRSHITPKRGSVAHRPPSRLRHEAERDFEPGDQVRVESLGMEGTLRYIGEVDFKDGIWAGVELSGGFAGRGKNNGSVAGRQYFTCASNCGIFVPAAKLSSVALRPPSSLSSYRAATPTGRTTPSLARPTPSSSSASAARKTKTSLEAQALENKIQPGSRASKYLGMTASQLREPTTPKAPTRAPSSTMSNNLGATPKAYARPSIGGGGIPTPRARTATQTKDADLAAMPPPPSPSAVRRLSTAPGERSSTPTRLPENGYSSTPPLMARAESRATDRPPSRMSERASSRLGGERERAPSRAGGDAASAEMQNKLDQLQLKIAALERENATLLSSQTAAAESTRSELASVRADLAFAQAALSSAKDARAEAERLAEERARELGEAEKARREAEGRVEEGEKLAESLRKAAEEGAERERAEGEQAERDERDRAVRVKEAEIEVLQERVKRIQADAERDRTEAEAMIQELRKAGQETIALYEERINGTETRRYELEDRLRYLESENARLLSSAGPNGTAAPASPRRATTAAEIDNENLTEQNAHLSKRLAALEEQLADGERDKEALDAAWRAKVDKRRGEEERAREEGKEAREEADRARKAESKARERADELEDALRENKAALEAARAEVETLRSDIENLENLQSGVAVSSDERFDDLTRRADAERTRLTQEIETLKALLDAARSRSREAEEEADSARREIDIVKDELRRAEEERAELERNDPITGVSPSASPSELQTQLSLAEAEISRLRAKLDAGPPLSPTPNASSKKRDSAASFASSLGGGGKDELQVLREQVTGLKHLISDLEVESGRAKMLEAENEHLGKEVDELKKTITQLEELVEQTLESQEGQLDAGAGAPPASPARDTIRLHKQIAESRSRNELLEERIAELERKIAELEKNHKKALAQLNGEISELESLVEAKIYKEDELEQEIDRLRTRLAHAGAPPSSASSVTSGHSRQASVDDDREDDDDDFAKLMRTLSGDRPAPPPRARTSSPLGYKAKGGQEVEYCDDCEEYGHSLENCTAVQDVF